MSEPAESTNASGGETLVHGRCVAAESRVPLPGCLIRLLGFAPRPGPVTSAADGTFAIRVELPAHAVTLEASAAECCTLWRSVARAGPVLDVGELALPPGAVLAERLVDEAGAPVEKERVGLACEALQPSRAHVEQGVPHLKPRHHADSDATGALPALVLAPGRWTLQARDHRIVRPDALMVGQGLRELVAEIVVARSPTIRGNVVDEEGRAVRGVLVGGNDGSRAVTAIDGSFTLFRRSSIDDRSVVEIAPGRGHVQVGEPALLAWGTDDARLVVRSVPPSDHFAASTGAGAGKPSRGSATLRGRLQPPEILTLLAPARGQQPFHDRHYAAYLDGCAPRLALREIGGELRSVPADPCEGVPIAADGGFTIDGVPAGDWRLVLLDRRASIAWNDFETRELLAVRGLRDGEIRSVIADVQTIAPATVCGRILLDGEPWRDLRARLGPWEFATGPEGEFSVEIHAGEYHLDLLLGTRAADRWLRDETALRVRAGERLSRTFAVRRRRARIRLLEADGRPASHREVTLSGPTFDVRADFPLDADGCVLVDPFPAGPVHLVAWPRGLSARTARAMARRDLERLARLQIPLGPIQLPPDRVFAEFEVRLPGEGPSAGSPASGP